MRQIALLITILFLHSFTTFACCVEWNYRLFPIGEINNEVVFIEFDFSRNCKNGSGGELENEFWIKGTVNLLKKSNDSLFLIENIDSIQVKECTCTYKNFYEKSEYESIAEKYYTQALTRAKAKKGFKIAIPKQIIYNDTIDTRITESTTDDTYSYIIEYKDLLKIDLSEMVLISCEPDIVAEVRTYETENFEVIIIRLRCHNISTIAQKYNTERFKKIETAFWKEQAQWHGIAKDFYYVKKK